MNRIFIVSWIALSCFIGCNKGPSVCKVTGKVKLKGSSEPLEFIVVEFWPENGPNSRGKSDSSGSFNLRTMDASDLEGVVPGSHKVTFIDTWPMKDDYLGEGGDWVDMSKGKKPRISSKYSDPAKSPISITIDNEQKTVEFELDPYGK